MTSEAARALAREMNGDAPRGVQYLVDATEPPRTVSPYYVRRVVDRSLTEKKEKGCRRRNRRSR